MMEMIVGKYSPITQAEAEYLWKYDYPGLYPYSFGCILRRLVYAGATPEASQTLDQLSEPLEQYMTSTEASNLVEPVELGRLWRESMEDYEDSLWAKMKKEARL